MGNPLFVAVFAGIWATAQIAELLVWMWFWQLKEYHWGRVRAHLETHNGRRLLFTPRRAAKVLAIALITVTPLIGVAFTAAIYLGELLRLAARLSRGGLVRPQQTLRTLITLGGGVAVIGAIATAVSTTASASAILWLVVVDVASPLVFSVLIMIFEPVAAAYRHYVMNRARRKREQLPHLTVIGIAGSYGKTATKEYVAAILEPHMRVVKTRQHENAEVGVSRRILQEVDTNTDVFVCEMGAYNRGGITILCDVAQPHIGVLTGVNEQHMATFGTPREGIELLEWLPESGTAIWNGASESAVELVMDRQKTGDIRAGTQLVYHTEQTGGAAIWAENVAVQQTELSFTAVTDDGERADFTLPLAGSHHIENILGAALTARQCDISLADAARALEDSLSERPPNVITGRAGATVLDSSYSSNPHGVVAEIEHLRQWADYKKIVVMPCLIELGRSAPAVHRRIGEHIGAVCDRAVITTTDCVAELTGGAKTAGMEHGSIVQRETVAGVRATLEESIDEHAVILIAGRVPPTVKQWLLAV